MAKILLADDDQNLRTLVLTYLISDGHEVIEAADGVEAMKKFTASRPDLVLTDICMPGKTGIEFLQEAKSLSPHTPVLLMTGQPSVEAAVECLRSGASDFLIKPFDFDRLDRAVKACLKAVVDRDDTIVLPLNREFRSFAGFEIKHVLGHGNCGIVYLAEKEITGERLDVALKIMKDFAPVGTMTLAEARERFAREAKTVARIKHPNIVEVYEFDAAEDTCVPYIAMEYVKGKTLDEKFTEEGLDYLDKVRIARQIASALEAIHEHGVLHRDIKPANVMIDDRLHVTLTDFGIVKTPDPRLTRASRIVGTPAYMAPEAFQATEIDGRSDLFSLGVLMYELCLGRLPFNGEGFSGMFLAITTKLPPKPRKLDRKFPVSLQIILGKLLKKEANERYQSAAELISDLDRFLDGQPIKAAPASRASSRRKRQAKDWA